MAYRRSRVNIRRPYRRRRATTIRRSSYSRSRPAYSRTRYASSRRPYRRRASTLRRRPQACSCPGDMSPGDKFVMTQSDPFDTKYFGSKIPDSSTLPSIPTPVQYNQTLSISPLAAPSMSHAWAFYPAVTGSFITAIGNSPTAWGWSGAAIQDAQQATAFRQQFEAYRPTAHAIRLSCPFAPTTTTGFVHIAIATETVYAGLGTQGQYLNLANSLATMSGYTFYKRVTLASLTQSPITLINKWTDETAFRYQAPAASEANDSGGPLTFQIPWSWGTLLVAVEGASTNNVVGQPLVPLQAEVVIHTECIPDKASTLLGSTAAAYNSGVLNAVSQAVAQTDFAHTEDQQDTTVNSYVQEVANAIGTSSDEIYNLAGSVLRTGLRYGARAAYNYAAGGGYGVGGVNNNPNRLAIM